MHHARRGRALELFPKPRLPAPHRRPGATGYRLTYPAGRTRGTPSAGGGVIVDVEAEAGRDVRAELAWAVVTKGHSLLGLQQLGMSLEEIFLELTREDNRAPVKED